MKIIIFAVGIICIGTAIIKFWPATSSNGRPGFDGAPGATAVVRSNTSSPASIGNTAQFLSIPPSAKSPVKDNEISIAAPYWKEAFKQGFATYVSNALRTKDANLAMGAFKILQTCEQIDSEAEALQNKLQSTSSADSSYKFLQAELTARRTEQRQCQGISAEMRENARNLLEFAARGGVVGAAAIYARSFTPALPLNERDTWLTPLLSNDANAGDLPSIYTLACDSRRQFVAEGARHIYYSALKWAAENSPEWQRAQQWVQACPFAINAEQEYSVSADLQTTIVNAARARLSGE